VRLVSRFRDAGFQFEMPKNLAVALGGTGMTLEHLTALYTALPNGGTPRSVEYLWRDRRPEHIASASRTTAVASPESGAPTTYAPLLQRASAWYVLDILRGTPPPAYASGGGIAFKTGTSYGYRDAWAVGFDGAHLVAVWIGRPDATSVADLMGLQAAAPVVFELFAAISPHRTPFPQPHGDIVVASKSADLPPPLRRFRETIDTEITAGASISPSFAQTPLRIAFPPAGAEIEIGPQPLNSSALSLPLKAEGGTLPLTWLVDGQPLASAPHRREAFFTAKGPGFVQVTVIDSEGRSDRSQIRLR
jgi:penicillin-binding protein 1C